MQDGNEMISFPLPCEKTERKPRQASPKPPASLVVRIADQLLVFRDFDYAGPQCVALRKSKRRCAAPVEEFSTGANMQIYLAGQESYVWVTLPIVAEHVIAQRCREHFNSAQPDAVAPEWTVFDPAADADLVRRNWPLWTPGGIKGGDRTVTEFIDSGVLGAPERCDPQSTLKELLAKMPARNPGQPTALYKWYDNEDAVLYIGISDDLAGRTSDHTESSSWMDFAARAVIERHPTRRDAKAAETAAIKAEKPLFNFVHNSGPEAQQRLVEYLVKHGRADLLAPAISRG